MPKIIITDGEKFYRKIMVALVMAEPTLEPTITPGYTVIMGLTQRQFAPGRIFVVNLDGTQFWCRLSITASVHPAGVCNAELKDYL